MAGIPNDIIESVKKEADIVAILALVPSMKITILLSRLARTSRFISVFPVVEGAMSLASYRKWKELALQKQLRR